MLLVSQRLPHECTKESLIGARRYQRVHPVACDIRNREAAGGPVRIDRLSCFPSSESPRSQAVDEQVGIQAA